MVTSTGITIHCVFNLIVLTLRSKIIKKRETAYIHLNYMKLCYNKNT